jgi:rhamnosyltransferase
MIDGVCAIVVTYRIGPDVVRCFESVREQVQEVVFVDNGGDRETLEALREIESGHAGVQVFRNPGNVGIAAALNTGVRYALQKQYRWVLTLDHDSEATPGMVGRLIAAYGTLGASPGGKVGIVAAEMVDRNLPSPPSQGDELRRVATCISSGSLIAREAFDDVGLFDESLFLYYVDNDFCLRCADHGWGVYICRTAPLLHREGFRQKRSFLGRSFIYRNYGPAARYYMSRNAIAMLKRHWRHGRHSWAVVHRLASDLVTTLLFGRQRWRLMRSMLTGFAHGLVGRYGKAPEREN